MRKLRFYWLCVIAAFTVVALSLAVMPASGAIIRDTSPAARVKTVRITTHRSGAAIIVQVDGLGNDVAGIDFYRSEVRGTDGIKLNSAPVTDRQFMDTTVRPGVQYYSRRRSLTRVWPGAPLPCATPRSLRLRRSRMW